MAYEIPAEFLVEGIREVDQHAVANRSQLLVPKTFDRTRYSGKWAFVGASAEAAQLPQRLASNYAVDGWQVWKDDEGSICERPLGGKKVILLFRPRTLQKAVNAIYGNMSKDRTIAEQQGRTVEGKNASPGIISETALRRYDLATEAEEPIGYQFNKIPAAGQASVGARGTTVKQTRKRATPKTT